MKAILAAYCRTSLILRISIALVLGVAFGLVGGESVAGWLAPFGDLLLRLLQFLIVPIVLFTLMVGVNQSEPGSMGRRGGRVFIYYVVTSALAIVVGLIVASLFEPGRGLQLASDARVSVPDNPGFVHVLLSIVPDNIVAAFTEPNLLGIIFTAFVFGVALLKLRHSEHQHELGERLYSVIEGLNAVTMKVMAGVLQYVPVGVFAIVAETVGRQGMATILSLGNMVAVLYIALAVQLVIYCVLMLAFGVRLRDFFREARTPMATAFATQSSSGSLPLSLDAARRLGIPQSLYGFSLPLGATVNMDGAAIRIAISAVFASNVVGVPLDLMSMIEIVLIGTLTSIGTAGVPGAGIVMIATVFAQVGLPIETVALLTSIDALVGMGCTALNVTGDLTGTALIARAEGRRIAATGMAEPERETG
ncbi:dicarboxylate/amino acid:cation symporter [Kushneria phosphatilytica]|uniref:Dicarboxylate/amino acid:cation symporter n=1 Tax=Kushneria phosphatilytica TaxID=657387 RepID=A0A1S1NZU7_9GAMM|nr:dicarboxylate/amino acid:cation symporter [Kushneria phosphatilytica]OHV13922.1 dicarboxylate/amino acid:cation symporter [Kushneria phosphatilytica]QEL10485.1 dicarboxylate/amino acid:cation symporter [Kushneria phosphatilytica]